MVQRKRYLSRLTLEQNNNNCSQTEELGNHLDPIQFELGKPGFLTTMSTLHRLLMLSPLLTLALLPTAVVAFAPLHGGAGNIGRPMRQRALQPQRQTLLLATAKRNNNKLDDDDDDDGREFLEIPLLNLLENDMVLALPSAHLPKELTTLNVYGMELTLPIHQTIVQAAIETQGPSYSQPIYLGQVACQGDGDEDTAVAESKKKDDWVGTVGCVVQILLPPSAFVDNDETNTPQSGLDVVAIQRLLCRGMNRFIVRDVKQSAPFVIAKVELLKDDETSASTTTNREDIETDHEEDEDDDEDDLLHDYEDLKPNELEGRLLNAMGEHVDQQLSMTEKEMSPLEQSLVEDFGHNAGLNAQHMAAEEEAAVFEVFRQYLVDELCYDPQKRYFALSFMAAEMTNLGNDIRRKLLQMTNTVERLRLVTASVEEIVAMSRARKLANAITDQQDDDERELKVGQPELPPWAKSIRKGMVVEYYWNEEFEWVSVVLHVWF